MGKEEKGVPICQKYILDSFNSKVQQCFHVRETGKGLPICQKYILDSFNSKVQPISRHREKLVASNQKYI